MKVETLLQKLNKMLKGTVLKLQVKRQEGTIIFHKCFLSLKKSS